jgi:hypothetical protein
MFLLFCNGATGRIVPWNLYSTLRDNIRKSGQIHLRKKAHPALALPEGERVDASAEELGRIRERVQYLLRGIRVQEHRMSGGMAREIAEARRSMSEEDWRAFMMEKYPFILKAHDH